MTPPVALFIYRRPEMTERVWQALARARPDRLFIVADGPKDAADRAACLAARRIVDRVTWPCERLTNYADSNLGCGPRMNSGLAWAFEQCEEAIILEDDCLPHPTFFRFCDEMLDRYRATAGVMSVTGANYQFGRRRGEASYYFSRYPLIWGWATWRRAWQLHDPDITKWTELRRTDWLRRALGHPTAAEYWRVKMDGVVARPGEYWDYPWMFACWANGGLTVTPNVNLVTNIGYGPSGTHTTNPRSRFASVPAEPMSFPLTHQADIVPHDDADHFFYQLRVDAKLFYRARRAIRRLPVLVAGREHVVKT